MKHPVTKKALEGATEAHSSARKVNKPAYVSSKEAMEGDVATFTFYNENRKIIPRGTRKYIKVDPSVGLSKRPRPARCSSTTSSRSLGAVGTTSAQPSTLPETDSHTRPTAMA